MKALRINRAVYTYSMGKSRHVTRLIRSPFAATAIPIVERRRMDIAGLHALWHQNVVVEVAVGTKFIGRLEQISNSTSTVMLVALDSATADQNSYAVNGVAALDINSIVFVQRLPNSSV